MQRIRLWTASLVSRVDGMVARIENHEALAASAIRDVRQAAARATVQLRRVRSDGERLRRERAARLEAEQAWRERATRSAETDRDKAIECLRRSKRAAREAAELERRGVEHERVEQQLARDVAAVEDRLSRLEAQRNLLATRQSRAEALGTVRDAQPCGAEVDDVFGRWETRVAEREFEGSCVTRSDDLESTFLEEEEVEELGSELDALLRDSQEDK
ncbi:MAG: PspA/IM30 family protein [Myxococcota bacterium]